MKLNIKYLSNEDFKEDYSSCYNARGLYDSMQFVLRLRPDIHAKLDSTPVGIIRASNIDFETIQAFSTYFHETIHWWQHIGSTSGLILSLSYPSQAHINHNLLKDYLKYTGPIKPIINYNKIHAKKYKPSDDEFKTINQIINNYNDIEYFKYLTVSPSSAGSFINDPLFECMGHSFHIAYSSFINVLSATFDRNLSFLPKADHWHIGFDRLRDKELQGYYHGSPIFLSPFGLKEIFEGQARFSQIQYLYFASGGNLNWGHFKDLGMLTGVYFSAFKYFLQLTNSEMPEEINDPLVALFLLICDIAMNPTDGFPFDIYHYESFIESVDPGTRFVILCHIIKAKCPELKHEIRDYSSSEYIKVSNKLCNEMHCPSPLDGARKVTEWASSQQELAAIMEEESTFGFKKENLPIRLIFSRYIRFQQDKLKNPAYFCWPGVHGAGEKCTDGNLQLFLEHQSLFTDKADGDIYPRKFPDKDEAVVKETFDTFYTWVATYDLCRQWIVGQGEFDYDFFWITSKYTRDELENWARNHFNFSYGIDPKNFKIL